MSETPRRALVTGATRGIGRATALALAGAFDSAEDFARNDVYGHPEWLDGIPVRIDCGDRDPFYTASKEFAGRLDPEPRTSFGKGEHEAAYWKKVAPAELSFLSSHLGP